VRPVSPKLSTLEIRELIIPLKKLTKAFQIKDLAGSDSDEAGVLQAAYFIGDCE